MFNQKEHRSRLVAADLFGEVKRIPILQVAKRLNISLSSSGMARCPSPDHRDQTPSFSVHRKSNTWRCFGCGRKGSNIDLVMVTRGTSFREAVAWLRGEGAVERVRMPSHDFPARQLVDEQEFVTKPDVYAWLLERSPLTLGVLRYLESRGITERTARIFELGAVPTENFLHDAIEKFGFDVIYSAGLLQRNSTRHNAKSVFPPGCILFPFMYQRECRYLQARRVTEEPKGRRWINLFGVRPQTFNANALLRSKSRDILICEGATDTLSAAEMGREAIGILGASRSIPPDEANLLLNRDVYIVADGDPAGCIFANRLSSQLSKLGISCIIQTLGDGVKDLNDLLMRRRFRARG